MSVGMSIMIAENLSLEGGEGLADLDHLLSPCRIPQFREIGLQTLSTHKIKLCALRLTELLCSRLKFVGVSTRSHQIHHFNPLATDFPNEIRKKWMKHRNFDLGTSEGAESHK